MSPIELSWTAKNIKGNLEDVFCEPELSGLGLPIVLPVNCKN